MSKEIDAEKLMNKLLARITQLEFENAKLMTLIESYDSKAFEEDKIS